MAKSEHTDRTSGLAPDLIAHLEQALGLSERQALDALGAYMVSTKAGRALCRELDSVAGVPLEAA